MSVQILSIPLRNNICTRPYLGGICGPDTGKLIPMHIPGIIYGLKDPMILH